MAGRVETNTNDFRGYLDELAREASPSSLVGAMQRASRVVLPIVREATPVDYGILRRGWWVSRPKVVDGSIEANLRPETEAKYVTARRKRRGLKKRRAPRRIKKEPYIYAWAVNKNGRHRGYLDRALRRAREPFLQAIASEMRRVIHE